MSRPPTGCDKTDACCPIARGLQVRLCQALDAFTLNRLEWERLAKGLSSEDNQLLRGVCPVQIEGGISFSITIFLRSRDGVCKL